ncbi:MAG: undecaprenyldiphospho-muramoylpentapeptide beta-N-acetylglucosaminyltransferase [Bacteroidota bacterium]
MKVIISGGGSGGHIFPAITIANELKRRDNNIDILFVGAKDKMEMEKVPKAGYNIEGLWISGFHRKLTLRNLMFPFKLLNSLWKSRSILKRFKPDVVIGVGGFASGPVLEMATRRGIPTLIQEQNSYAGITNKLLAKKVDRICVAYDQMERFFPKNKIIKTGNPVRQDINDLDDKKSEARAYFDLSQNKKMISIFGGSLGARTLNIAMRESEALLKAHPEVEVLWQAGKLYIDEYSKSNTAQLPNVSCQAFVDRMDYAYAASDIIIGRAGASTISELCIAGKAAILIPSPNVAEDHQTKNAKALVDKSAALLIANKDASASMIQSALDLLNNTGQIQTLESNIKKLALPNAAEQIVDEILKLVKST